MGSEIKKIDFIEQLPGYNEINPIQYADFGTRLAAYLIDSFLLMCLYSFIISITKLTVYSDDIILNLNSYALFKNPLYFTIPTCLYYSFFESSNFQGTPGKVFLRIKVKSENLEKISFGNGLLRFFGKILNIFTLFIGFIMISFNQKRQGFHDQLSKTVVIKSTYSENAQKSVKTYLVVAIILLILSQLLGINLK